MEFFQSLEPLLRIFWYIALPVSLIFVIQTIMTFVGADAGDGLEADFDGDLGGSGDHEFQLFSFRNLVNFLLGFSWTGISFYRTVTNHTLLIILAFIIGVAFVMIFFFVIKQMQKLAEDNSFKLSESIGKTAEVYLAIPEKKTGKGKVLISVKGSTRELEAMTEGDRIATGSLVKVAGIENDILIVNNM